MGIGKRIKEIREARGLTQKELGLLVDVTASAITNYENETSHPKEPIMYKLMNVLRVDANYLFQDCIDIQYNFQCSLTEQEIIKKYRALDGHGKKVIDFLLNEEYTRCADLDELDIFDGMTSDEVADHLAKLAREFEEMHPNKKQAANE